MLRSIFIIPVFLFIIHVTQAQTKKQWMNHGDQSFSERDYYGASLYYREALKKDTADIILVHKYAESLRHYNEYNLARKMYEYLYELDNGTKYPEALFWLATMQKQNGDYIAAKKSFQQFTSVSTDQNSFLYKKANHEIVSCEFAQRMNRNAVPVDVYNLGEPVNSENSEFSPLLKDSVLYFSSLRAEKVTEFNEIEDKEYVVEIFTAKMDQDQWELTGSLDSIIASTGLHVANASFSPSSQRFYFSACDSNFRCKIFSTINQKGRWKKPEPLPDHINAPGSTATQPSLEIVEGREVMFFSSDRSGSVGKMDIWYTVRETNGWSEPVNAGRKVNSIDDEISPWYDNTEKTLYFSSSWHNGFGGFDIFRSKGNLLALGEPENLGIPFNSSANDFYFTFLTPGDSTTGFLTSNRKGSISKKGETCCNDIWLWEYKQEAKEILISSTVDQVKALNKMRPVLYFHNDEPSPRSLDTAVTVSYEDSWKKYLALENEYVVKYQDEKQSVISDFFKNKVKGGMNDLMAFSGMLEEELKKGHKLRIHVKGHASPLAISHYNENLSKRRISSFINYVREFNNGTLKPYLNDSSLQIRETPLGEYEAAEGVSDDFYKKEKSVYSVEASLERRVTIEWVELISGTDSYSDLCFTEKSKEFGAINEGETVSLKFQFRNCGNDTLTISDIVTPCGCTVPTYSKDPVGPGETGSIDITFSSKGKKGPQEKIIRVYYDGVKQPYEISISGTVK